MLQRASCLGGAVAKTGIRGKARHEAPLYLSGPPGPRPARHPAQLRRNDQRGRVHRCGRAVRQTLKEWIEPNLDRDHADLHCGVAPFFDTLAVEVADENTLARADDRDCRGLAACASRGNSVRRPARLRPRMWGLHGR